MKATLRTAFEATRQGFSADRVVADPELNQAFLAKCAELGLNDTVAVLNRALLNLRKRGELRGLKSLRTSFPNQTEYTFAAEIAVRFLERLHHVTLDDIMCDPRLVEEFDSRASQVCPGASLLQYRWAALNLRKTQKLKPELLARVAPPERISDFAIDGLDQSQIPDSPGLYLFYSSDHALYIGETDNLRSRIRKHLDHSDNRGLARWLWQRGDELLRLEIQVLQPSQGLRVRRALEMELIRSRRPIFNVKR